ncbi:MAG: cation-transporting P-type ATPase [Candidatus Pacearchaeota archaeon]
MINKRGLSEEQAKKNLEIYGFNEIKETFIVSPIRIFLRQLINNYIIYLLLVAAILSFIVNKNITAYTIIFIIFLITLTGFFQEFKAEKAIKSLKSILMPVSIVVRDGKEKEIPSREIVPQDILILRSGEKVPADCIILEEKNLYVDESILTGESKEIKKFPIKSEKKYSEKECLFAGSLILSGKCIAKVIHTGMNTRFGKIANMISKAEKELPLQKKINKIAKYMVYVAIIFSVLTGILMIATQQKTQTLFIDALILIIALAVSAFPEGFPVVLTTALATGVYRMSKKNAIVNRMSIIETLGETTVICSDKTGTITTGEMTVSKIFCNNEIIEVSGIGYEGKGDFFINGKKIDPLNNNVLSLLIKSSVLCNDSFITRTGEDYVYNINGSATEGALLIMAAKASIHKEDLNAKRIEEIPFDSKKKMMSVLCNLENKSYVFSKGALEIILSKCNRILRDNGIFSLTNIEKKNILKMNKKFTSSSLRTLAIAYKEINSFDKDKFEGDLVFLGFVGIEDPPREEVKEAIKSCYRAGIEVKMITGDDKETAIATAKKINLREGRVITGQELEEITDEELERIIKEIVIFARVNPEHKLRIVKALKANKEIVTMTGDGVNDAPALKEAHIGVAMGKKGTDVSREVSDLVLKDDNFATIVEAIKEGRTIFKNIRKFVSYQLSCNLAELMILFIGVLLAPILGWQIPLLLAIQILFMNLVTDDLPAITLALTPYSSDIMEEKPRKNRDILNKDLIKWFCSAGILIAFFTLISFYISFNILKQDVVFARTTALTTLILLEIFNAYNFMSFRKKVSFKSFKANIYLFYASIISLLATLVIIYTPLNKVFETISIKRIDWIISILFGFLLIIIFNILKEQNNKKLYFKLDN